tara:strand:+ start:1735 stop:2442 length:708 start_codon:yes stop_codon:yes gene_type:complete
MGYFRQLPNASYPSPLSTKTGSGEYIIVKNFFRKVKVLDWLSDSATVFNKFVIADDARPDTVADEVYGSPDLDFVVVLTAGITNINNDWPLSDQHLYNYTVDKYGLSNVNNVHHYETIEVRDDKNRLIIESGRRVDSSFKIAGPGTIWPLNATWVGKTNEELIQYNGVSEISPISGISNWEYETDRNEQKRNIDLLRPEYIQIFLQDLKRIMRYDRNSQYIDPFLIKTENTTLLS